MKTATTSRRRRRGPEIPGLKDQIGHAAIDRGLAEEEARAAAAAEPSPPPPPPAAPGGIKDLGTKSTEETAKLIQGFYGVAIGAGPQTGGARTEEEIAKLPDVEAQLCATCLEKVVGADELLTPQRALYILVAVLGLRIFFGRKALSALRASKAAPQPPEVKS